LQYGRKGFIMREAIENTTVAGFEAAREKMTK